MWQIVEKLNKMKNPLENWGRLWYDDGHKDSLGGMIMILIALGYAVGFVYFTTASWPLYLDLAVFGFAVVASVPYVFFARHDMGSSGILAAKAATGGMAGAVAFILMFFWGGLSVSIWWYLLALVIGVIASFIPGGFTIASKVLMNMDLLPAIPGWISTLLIVADVICIIMYIQAFVEKKNE